MLHTVQRIPRLTVVVHKTIHVPGNYTKIQEAIDSANDGDTIAVSSGTYYENIVLDKEVNLLGANLLTTVIDGKQNGNVINIIASNVVIEGFTIKNGNTGIYLFSVGNCIVRRNNIVNNSKDGMEAVSSWSCTISENTASDNKDRGIAFLASRDCLIEYNTVERNEGYGLNLFDSRNSRVVGNAVQGAQKIGKKDWDAIGLYSCEDCIASENTANESHYYGVWLESSKNCLIDENSVNNNGYGIAVDSNSTGCIIKRNDVRNSRIFSLWLHSSSTNTLYHNNFVAAITNQVESTSSVNTMDNGAEGNYWNDYDGADHNNDGIGDTAYVIDADERDNYPLMARFASFSAYHPKGIQTVEMVSNSIISNFESNLEKSELKFNVSGENNTIGFCRIGIPKALLDGTFIVKIDGNASTTLKKLSNTNALNNYLYFTYTHSTHQVAITLETSQGLDILQLLPFILIAIIALTGVSALVLFTRRRKSSTQVQNKK